MKHFKVVFLAIAMFFAWQSVGNAQILFTINFGAGFRFQSTPSPATNFSDVEVALSIFEGNTIGFGGRMGFSSLPGTGGNLSFGLSVNYLLVDSGLLSVQAYAGPEIMIGNSFFFGGMTGLEVQFGIIGVFAKGHLGFANGLTGGVSFGLMINGDFFLFLFGGDY